MDKSTAKRLAIQNPKSNTVQNFVDEATKHLHAEIESLRQQVAELLNTVADNATVYVETLALREFENSKLREALSEISVADPNGWCIINHSSIQARHVAKQALSTKFTPDHLNEWLKEQVGEPVAWVWDDGGYDMYTNDFEYMKSIQKYKLTVPLYEL